MRLNRLVRYGLVGILVVSVFAICLENEAFAQEQKNSKIVKPNPPVGPLIDRGQEMTEDLQDCEGSSNCDKIRAATRPFDLLWPILTIASILVMAFGAIGWISGLLKRF